jgi:PTS system nitrogen regulatory IIA component
MNETMSLAQLAVYLRRDARDVERLAARNKIPGRKAGGKWRFHRREIDQWLDHSLSRLSSQELAAIESGLGGASAQGAVEPLLMRLLPEKLVAVPLLARTRASALKALVELAGRTGQVSLPYALLDAILDRERTSSTALDSGVAFPHPRHPLPHAVGVSLVAYGRTRNAIPFGAPGGGLTDVFFLVCCTEPDTHLRVLARLARLLRLPEFLGALRAAESPPEVQAVIQEGERRLLAGARWPPLAREGEARPGQLDVMSTQAGP